MYTIFWWNVLYVYNFKPVTAVDSVILMNTHSLFLKTKFIFIKGECPHFHTKGGGLLTSLLGISLWFFACRPELWSSFWIKHQSGEKIIPPPFSCILGHFFKNFVIDPCGVSKVINIGPGNSILDILIHFPMSLYHSPPFPTFSPSKRPKTCLLILLLEISLWLFACRPELWSSFWIKHQNGGGGELFDCVFVNIQ